MEVLNLFQLHGKWFENNENRVTSSLLFFLNEFKVPLLQYNNPSFFIPYNLDYLNYPSSIQVY